MKIKHILRNVVASFGVASVALLIGACQGIDTPTPTRVVDITRVPPTQAPPTRSLIQNPIVEQPIIAPTTVMVLSGTGIPGDGTATVEAPKSLGQAQVAGNLSLGPSNFGWQSTLGSDNAAKDNTFLFITINVSNISETDEAQFEPTQLVLLDATGQSFSLTVLPSAKNEFKSTHLNPAEQATGIIVYEVPKGHEKEKWQLQYNSPAGTPLTWVLTGSTQ
jgi:hypothetical protein